MSGSVPWRWDGMGVLACVCLALRSVGRDALRWNTARWAFPWCPILRPVWVSAAGLWVWSIGCRGLAIREAAAGQRQQSRDAHG